VRKLTSAIRLAEGARRHAERHHKSQVTPTMDRRGLHIRPNVTASERQLVCDLLRSAIESQEGLDGASDDPAGVILARSTLGKIAGAAALDSETI
jgi:hypothetical protein